MDPENYVFKFGVYRLQKAIDVMNIKKTKTNKKGEQYIEDTGKKYLEFLVSQPRLHDADKQILKKILKIEDEPVKEEPKKPKKDIK